jgi:hypothetical protein
MYVPTSPIYQISLIDDVNEFLKDELLNYPNLKYEFKENSFYHIFVNGFSFALTVEYPSFSSEVVGRYFIKGVSYNEQLVKAKKYMVETLVWASSLSELNPSFSNLGTMTTNAPTGGSLKDLYWYFYRNGKPLGIKTKKIERKGYNVLTFDVIIGKNKFTFYENHISFFNDKVIYYNRKPLCCDLNFGSSWNVKKIFDMIVPISYIRKRKLIDLYESR